MGRGGVTKDREDGPDRKCIATGEVQPKYGLIRFVVGPEDVIYPDISGKLPGRGIYVAADRDALEMAVEKKLFSRGAKQQVKVPDDLVDEVERQLARKVVDLIAMSRKAGSAVAVRKNQSVAAIRRSTSLVSGRRWVWSGQVEIEYTALWQLHWLADFGRIGFGVRTPNCDTWGARLWWTHQTCCRGSPKVTGRATRKYRW